jgi:pimeloyl-ACP methyl ester carboxylesterase
MTSTRLAPWMPWRTVLLTVLSLLLATTALIALSTTGRALAAETKPTIVLVHGAWASPGGWDQVVSRLRADGYTTVTPRLDLLGIDSDVATVRSVLDAIPGDKIVVAHSYGGVVASNATAGRSDVRALVFTAAFVPDAGDSILSMGAGYNPPAPLAHLVWTGTPWASLALIDPAFFPADFAADLSPMKAAVLNAGQQPTSPAILVTPSGPVGWHAIPSWYAISGMDRVIDPAQQLWMAQRAGATIVRFDDASHAGGYTHYSARFTKLVEDAVAATTN